MNNQKIERLPGVLVKNILIWDKNPRFIVDFNEISDINYNNDNDLIKNLVNQELEQADEEESDKLLYFKQLLDSLLEKGFVNDNDSIFIKKSDKQQGYYYVLEGNRRICALKIILHFLDKNEDAEWKKWFISKFGDDYWDKFIKNISKQKSLGHQFDTIDCYEIISNDIDFIKQKIYQRDQVNSLGKKYWFRIVRLLHILKEYKLIFQNEKNELIIINRLSKIFDKSVKSISKDLDSARWVYSCLKEYGKNENEMQKLRVSSLELSRSKIIDPMNELTLSKSLNIVGLKPNNKWFYTYKINNENFTWLSFNKLAIFLCRSYFEKHFYSTRGWDPLYENKLVDFLYPNFNIKNRAYITMPYKTIKTLMKDKEGWTKFNDLLSNDGKQEWFNNIISNIDIIAKKSISIKNLLIKIKPQIEEIIDEWDINEERWKASFVSLYGLIRALSNEWISQQFIEKSSIDNFPFSKYSLIFRNIFIIFCNSLIINPDSFNKISTIVGNDWLYKIRVANPSNPSRPVEQKLTCANLQGAPSFFDYSNFEYLNINGSIFFSTHNFATYLIRQKTGLNVKNILNDIKDIVKSMTDNWFQHICGKCNGEFEGIDCGFFIDFINNDYSEINKMVHFNHYMSISFFPSRNNFMSTNFSTLSQYLSEIETFLESINRMVQLILIS